VKPVVYSRFAIFYVPPEGPFATLGHAWLGWDSAAGCSVQQPNVSGIEKVTRSPRKYGFHGTLKPPFRLANAQTMGELKIAVSKLAQACAPAQCDGLTITALGRFLALTPVGNAEAVSRVASTCVVTLDRFRAPLTADELAKRRRARLSARQEELLERWGYPYVMEAFRFHMTLTGRLPVDDIPYWTRAIQSQIPALPEPFVLDEVALVGERPDGLFEVIERYPLNG
jgi:putative phosphonate metabolism protein